MSSGSKPLGGVDEEAKRLIQETLDGADTGGFDVDSIFFIEGRGWIVFEFLKCDTVRPFDSHPNRYWYKNSQKFLSLWRLTSDLEGELVLVNYEDSREQFKIIEVEDLDEKGIQMETISETDFDGFQEYYMEINNAALSD